MTDRPDRSPIHAYVPKASHDAWHAFAVDHGPSVSALLDAIGRRLATGETKLDMIQVARQARQIDSDNRRRRP